MVECPGTCWTDLTANSGFDAPWQFGLWWEAEFDLSEMLVLVELAELVRFVCSTLMESMTQFRRMLFVNLLRLWMVEFGALAHS